MKIEPKAFIAIEKTMAAAMRVQWDVVARGLLDHLHPLIEAKKWGEAQEAVNRLTLDGIVSDVRPKIEEMCVSALLFGAHHATGDVKATSFAKGKKLPQELHNAIAQLEHMVEANGRDHVCNQLHVAIEAMKRADAESHLQKHDIYTEPDKRPDAQVAEDYDPEADPDQDGETARRQEKFLGQAAHQYKVDISGAQLAETGGLLEPEQAEARPPRKGKRKQTLTKTEGPKTLHVNRPLLNGAQVIAWAKENGFGHAQKPEDMHVTICYSKTPFDWDDLQPKQDNVTVVGGKRDVKVFGDATGLTFESDILAEDHQELRDAGASYDFDEYRPHVTITWERPPEPFTDIKPFDGNLLFGPEVFRPINKDWQKDHEELVLKWERLFKADDRSLADKLNDAVARGGAVAIDTGAQLTTSRLVSLGFLAQAVEQGTTSYVVNEVLDDRTCPVCQYMHGKTFSVQQQFDRTVHQLAATDPASLRDLAPWPDQSAAGLQSLYSMSAADMQGAGYGSPPYHPGCRGFLVLVGSVDEEIPLGGGDLAVDTGGPMLQFSSLESARGAAASEAAVPMSETSGGWTIAEIDRLKWERFDVTEPTAFAAVESAFEAGDYDQAQQLIDHWKASVPSPLANKGG